MREGLTAGKGGRGGARGATHRLCALEVVAFLARRQPGACNIVLAALLLLTYKVCCLVPSRCSHLIERLSPSERHNWVVVPPHAYDQLVVHLEDRGATGGGGGGEEEEGEADEEEDEPRGGGDKLLLDALLSKVAGGQVRWQTCKWGSICVFCAAVCLCGGSVCLSVCPGRGVCERH